MEYKDTKLIVFLKTFSVDEIKEFEKFISTPYFKQSRDPLPLFKILKSFHPDFNSDKFKEEIIFEMLYPGADFSDKKFRNNFRSLSSYLLKSVEEFLFISAIKKNKVLRNRKILETLLNRNLLKYYESYLQIAEKDLKEDENLSGKNDIEQILLSDLRSIFSSRKNDLKEYLNTNFRNTDVISSYFIINLLRSAKTKFLVESYNNLKTENNSIERYLKAVDIEEILDIHKGSPEYVHIYFNYYIYQSLINNYNYEFYKKAKNIFFENKSDINRKDLNYYYSDLMNIIDVHRKSDDVKNKEYFELLNNCLKDKAYKVSKEDFMHPDFYRNAILFAGRLKEYDWADKFVIKFTDELKPDLRDNMRYFSKAVILYGKGEFEKSLEYVSKIKYDLVYFKTDVKIYLMRIYYELEMTDQIYYLADTFRHYINNSKNLSPEIKNTFLNYIKYFLRIVKLKLTFDSKESGLIRDQLKKEKLICERNWLTEKLDKIELQRSG